MGAIERRRLAAILWGVLIALWCVQVWHPQLSYPVPGVLQVVLLLAILGLAAFLYRRSAPGAGEGAVTESKWSTGRLPLAGCLGAAFVTYAWVRWAAKGFPAVGADNFGTLLGCALWATVGYYLLGAWWRHGRTGTGAAVGPEEEGARIDSTRPLLTFFYATIATVALLVGLHALAQYRFLYDRALADLLSMIGTAEPTPVQAGLVHHLRLKRVASVWGDPNTLAGFSAFSLAASIYCAGAWGRFIRAGRAGSPLASLALTVLGSAAIPAAFLAIGLSGSRGGVLSALLILGIYGFLGIRRRPKSGAAAVAAGLLVLLFAAADNSRAVPAGGEPLPSPSGSLPAFLTRMDTVRERLNYTEVGTAIWARNPVFGSGLGAVDLYYGRYKPAQAREAKYLHNWVLQIAAELGAVGLALALAFVGALLRPGIWTAARRISALRPALAIAVVFLWDALIQLSSNQRELMALFGLVIGVLLAGGRHGNPIDGSFPSRRGGGVAALVFTALLMVAAVVHLIPSLYAAGQKQAAVDALEEGETSRAVRHLRQAAAWTPRDPWPLVSLGIIESDVRGPNSGAMFLERALLLQPESASLHAHLARMRLRAGRLEEAEFLARRALELYPTNAEHHDLASRIAEARGDRAGALAGAREAARFGYLNQALYQLRVEELEK